MTDLGTTSGLEELPAILPVFPLTGALLLTTGHLPLNVFEPRYLDMVRDCMTSHRVIGIVQPRDPEHPSATPPLYTIGCAGKICELHEQPNETFHITLEGLCRFRIQKEVECTTRYRQVVADYAPFHHDLTPPQDGSVDREALQGVLRHFLELESEEADWEALNNLADDNLVNSLSMICPFAPAEKQALLEAEDVPARSELLICLLRMMMQQGQPHRTLQ
ncbi:LON peptidase substrate-binding domain-containing protein [Sneathiella chinensis]|uniref:ATP-dependent protease n=1 Tax=Sneathiella chinensis TaxID=349750 RepID=A0ABQ5U0R6_9PROT|nr:LON peptidase substrate-binding domain-containing protein [Sneathiella chinensis]GLQ05016.1 ATP-dependent protease [Sneathiella chinensis]